MNKLLVVCPTRGRVKQCERMICSAKNTSTSADFIFYYDDNDPKWREYLYLFSSWEKPGVRHIMGTRRTTTELINLAFIAHPDYDFYCITNDDFVFQTHGWDETLCRKGKICYGNDLCAGDGMPTCPVIDGDIVRAVGWLQLPGLRYMYGDAVWKMIGLKLGIIKYIPQVIIEHYHWLNKKAEIDDVYKTTNSPETYKADEEVYRIWHKEKLEEDTAKIRAKLDL